MLTLDLQTLDYLSAWRLQEQAHADVLAGAPERILFVQHPPVITIGRRPNPKANLLATPDQLAKLHINFIESDRGGDITFHGPGQLVAYPIIRLADHHLSVSAYVHSLEHALISLLKDFNIPAQTDPTAVGVWTPNPQNQLAKIAAIGVRIRRGVSLHGLALNVTTDLSFFNLIIPCGLASRPVTSLQQLLPHCCPTLDHLKPLLAHHLQQRWTITPCPT